jgi:serine/threonine-protein kinase
MAERMHQPAFQPSELDDEDADALDVEDDEAPHDEASPGRNGAGLEHGAQAELRRSHITKRDAGPDSFVPRDGAIIGNRYRVESISQRDGATVVLRAHHLELGSKALIRYLSPRAARRGDAVNRFLRSARMAARVHSEHVARVTDIGRFGLGVPFVVTEAVEGWTLEEVLRVRGPLPVQEAVEYVVQAGSGMAAAHAAGVLHGALNLRHLVLSRRVDGSPLVRVEALGSSAGVSADFSSEPDASRGNGALEATVPFIAPEQVRDVGDVDERADVWALGAILHTLISGRPPFQGTTAPAVLAAIAADAPTPLADLQRDVAPGLESAVLQCLAKERDERFSGVADLLSALRPFASGDAVAALERVTRTTRPPPLPGMPPSSRSLPPTPPRRSAIVPVPRPPVAAAAPKTSYLAGAAGVGAGVGAAVALVMAMLLKVGAPAAAAPPVAVPLVAAPTAVPPIAPSQVAPVAPVSVAPTPVAQPAAVAPAATVVATPAVAPPADPKPVVQRPQQAMAKAAPKATTKVAEKPEPVAGRSEGDLFDDPR